jgi:hypothetical protein
MNPSCDVDPASLESFWVAEVTPKMTHVCWKRYMCFFNRTGDSERFEGVADRLLSGPSESLLLYILCHISIEDNISNVIAPSCNAILFGLCSPIWIQEILLNHMNKAL